MIWFILGFFALMMVVCSVLLAGMIIVDLVDWRREERVGELMDSLARRGDEILERERR